MPMPCCVAAVQYTIGKQVVCRNRAGSNLLYNTKHQADTCHGALSAGSIYWECLMQCAV
jgi:hypothetical protein